MKKKQTKDETVLLTAQTVPLQKDGITLIQTTKVGPYTIMVVRDDVSGIQGIGQARCSERDRFGKSRGEVIAYGRARKALAIKLYNVNLKAEYAQSGEEVPYGKFKELRNWYLG